MRKITWKQMLEIQNNTPAITGLFNVAFVTLPVIRFEGGEPIVSCSGEEFITKSAESVYCSIK